MTTLGIKQMQQRVGTEPDGFWGPKSIVACQVYLRSMMPMNNPWPKQDEQSLLDFYGIAGDETQLVNLPVGRFYVLYDGDRVKTIRCHNKVADSLLRVITEVARLDPDLLLHYDGCFANRSMRGGSRPSLHARGAAIDFDAANNGNTTHWPTVATMPLSVMECFAHEGWLAAGAFWGRDAMHFQATR